MTLESIMTKDPKCCTPNDTIQTVAQMMKSLDVGALPVVSDQVSKELIGMVTDRDLCTTAMAEGRDPRTTKIEPFYTRNVVTCLPEDTLDACEKKMMLNRIRRIPVVDHKNRCVGIVVQADLARVETPEKFKALLAEISTPKMKTTAVA